VKRDISQSEYERRQVCRGDSALKIPDGGSPRPWGKIGTFKYASETVPTPRITNTPKTDTNERVETATSAYQGKDGDIGEQGPKILEE
jgi:hypothetical protein